MTLAYIWVTPACGQSTCSDISVSASLGASVTMERPFCWPKITRQVSQLLEEEEVALSWPRVESPETDSGLASHGSRAHFLFTRGTEPGFPVGLQDASWAGAREQRCRVWDFSTPW